MPGIVHLVSLQGSAGVEVHFSEFVQSAAQRFPEWSHGWLNPAGEMHPSLRGALDGNLVAVRDAKRIGPIKLPSKPALWRVAHCRRAIKQMKADVAVVWNRTARSQFLLDAIGQDNVIHWEHGRAWHAGREQERRRYLQRIPWVIANSWAAKRLLELRWECPGEIRVCLNALRPSLMPDAPTNKSYPRARRVRLGVVARLLPVKGVALALHSLKTLRADSVDAELHIAGDGPDRDRLESTVDDLGLAAVTKFHGVLQDMTPFYDFIDLLVHLPLTEAFGLVGIEAAAHGCPVIAAAVDGLPEAVQDGVSGYCLEPSLPLSEYESFGSDCNDVPPCVYDPTIDSLRPPRLVDPAAVAIATRNLLTSTATFESMSRSASERVVRDFRFVTHVTEVMNIIDAFARRDR